MAKIVGTNINDTLLGGADADLIFGLAGDDSLKGAGGNDTLNGGIGADTLIGGDGDDVYIVDSAGDVVTEVAAQGVDEVRTALSTLTAFAGVEKFTFTGTKAVTFSGNDENNVITGTGANDTLLGLLGDDTIAGGKGADSMAGGTGFDAYFVDNAKDIVDENGADGIDRIVSSISLSLVENGSTLLGSVEDLQLTGKANLTATGNGGVNFISGNDGSNKLDGGGGSDILADGNGNDTLLGGGDNDFLLGGGGNDSLDGGTGADTMDGGEGSDLYIVDVGADQVGDSGAAGIDTIISSVSFMLFDAVGIENLVLAENAGKSFGFGDNLSNRITGNSDNNTLDGADGVDTLDGGAGDDSLQGDTGENGKDLLIGGLGNDILIVGDNDIILEGAKGGTDSVFYVGALGTYTLGANLENLFLDVATPAQSGIGNGIDNQISGTNGADTLDGKGGADMLRGFGGDDIYFVDNALDQIVEFPGEGADEMRSIIALASATEFVEHYTFLTSKAVSFTGSNIDNRITGGKGGDSLNGGDGSDTLFGGIGNDTLDGDFLADALAGGAGNDRLKGGAGVFNDTLDGGLGADTMDGGDGDDTYFVDNIGDKAREIFDDADSGLDTVVSTVTHTLGFGIEALALQGKAAISGTGNDLNNFIGGNDGANKLSGLGGTDLLTGSDGNDTLDGGTGADTMDGGIGNDTYIVDNRNDIVSEGFDGGIDTIFSSIGFDLAAAVDVENLILTGDGDVGAKGNGLDNRIIGNGGSNEILEQDLTASSDTLDGGAGNDILVGGGGNDSLIGGDGADSLTGGFGDDTIVSAKGNDIVAYRSAFDGHDIVAGFDGNAAGGQDVLDLDQLFDSLFVDGGDRAARVNIVDKGKTVEVRVDTDGDLTFDLFVATIQTPDVITVGQDVLMGS